MQVVLTANESDVPSQAAVMTVDNTELGQCPNCDQSVPADEMVIDYKGASGKRVTAAKCPKCVTVVTL